MEQKFEYFGQKRITIPSINLESYEQKFEHFGQKGKNMLSIPFLQNTVEVILSNFTILKRTRTSSFSCLYKTLKHRF